MKVPCRELDRQLVEALRALLLRSPAVERNAVPRPLLTEWYEQPASGGQGGA